MDKNSLPKMLQYRSIKPKGFPSEFKRWELLPQASSSNYNLLDVVRFQFKTDWFIDPYQTYMDIEVEFPQSAQNMGIGQENIISTLKNDDVSNQKKNISNIPVYSLDGPATSLLQEMILYSNGKEVERIQEYDVLGNLIADLGVPASKRANKKFEGYHYHGQFQNFNQYKFNRTTHNLVGDNNVRDDGCFQKTGMLSNPFSFDDVYDYNHATQSLASMSNTDKLNRLQAMFLDNTTSSAHNDITGSVVDRDTVGRSVFRNYAREYVLSDGSMGVDHALTRNSNPIHITVTDNASLISNAENDVYKLNTTQLNNNILKNNKRVLFNHESSVNQFDYMCPGIQAIKYQNGVYQDVGVRGAAESINATDVANQQKLGVFKKVFHVPILSAVMGHLIPSEQWSLIPGKGCGDMVWEFRLNRYAFFSSGHLDNQKPRDADGVPAKQFTMDWKITKISIRFDLWNFPSDVVSIIDNLIASEQCLLTTQGFTLGPTTQIESTSQVRGNYHINNGILSLKNIYIFFLLNDYQTYNYCAKNFRVSHNVKSLQLKIGNEYIPKQAIMGNAGNLVSNLGGTDDDVYPFLMELYRSQGEMFNITNRCSITPFSFCLNDRVYNPSSRLQTSCQQALLHEQRARGKAIYTIDMQADPFDTTVLTGYDTTKVRPIELLIDTNINTGALQRSSTMYIYLHHDTIVQFTKNGIVTTCYG